MLKCIKKYIKKVINWTNKFLLNRENVIDNIRKIQDRSLNHSLFIFPSPGTPWGYMFQRPQQIATVLSKMDYTVFYSVEGNFRYIPDKNVRGIVQLSDTLYLHNDFARGNTFQKCSKIILWRYWASQQDFLPIEKGFDVFEIYDWIDDINVFGYSKQYVEQHEKILHRANLVIATSKRIYEKALKYRDDVIYIPNACDYDFFSCPKPIEWVEINDLRSHTEVIVGYYGAIASWFDFDLLVQCAVRYPNWTFLLVGELYEHVLDNIDLKKYRNVILWERVEYNKLPYLLSKFDIAIIPFKLNEITQSTSPIKIYEYMAGGKPVVTTALQEVKKMENVLVAEDKESFVKLLYQAQILSKDLEYLTRVKKEAKNNSWDKRVKKILEELMKRGIL